MEQHILTIKTLKESFEEQNLNIVTTDTVSTMSVAKFVSMVRLYLYQIVYLTR